MYRCGGHVEERRCVARSPEEDVEEGTVEAHQDSPSPGCHLPSASGNAQRAPAGGQEVSSKDGTHQIQVQGCRILPEGQCKQVEEERRLGEIEGQEGRGTSTCH